MNVNSVSFISEYQDRNAPYKERVTVDGPSVKRPGNVEV